MRPTPARFAIVVLLVAVAACTQPDGPSPAAAPTSDAAASAGPASPDPTAAADPTTETFSTASDDVACQRYTDAVVDRLSCEVRSGLTPPPDEPCDLDWGGLVLDAGGRGAPSCHSDTFRVGDEVVVPAGTTWSSGPFTCDVSEDGVACSTDGGGTLALAVDAWSVS